MSIECRHIVAVGDTLFQIAERYGTTVEKLGFLNMMKSEALSVGQELILPDCYDPFSNDSLEFICQSLYEDMVVRSTSQVLGCHVVDINSIDKHRALASGLIAAVDVMGYVEPGVEVCFRSLGDLVFHRCRDRSADAAGNGKLPQLRGHDLWRDGPHRDNRIGRYDHGERYLLGIVKLPGDNHADAAPP